MFQSAIHPPVNFAGFGVDPFDKRIADLVARRRRIAYYYDTPDTSTFRYRVLNMVQAINSISGGDTSASWFCRADLNRMERFIDRADALVVCRARYTPMVDQMINRARVRGVPIFYDCDDFVFDPDYVPLLMATLDRDLGDNDDLNDWFALVGRSSAVMRLCDRTIATNDFLAARMMQCGHRRPAHVIPNFLNREQQKLSAWLYHSKLANGFSSDGELVIGYFSGSPSHNRDFAVVAAALGQILADDLRIRLRVVGFLELNGTLANYADRIEFVPLQDPMNLQRYISEVEINIAPLQSNLFTNCKSELKFFEAAVTGTITVATPVHTFARSIEHGRTSFLAESHEWFQMLKTAINVVDNPGEYRAMAERGYQVAVERYGWDVYGKSIVDSIFGAERPASASPPSYGRVTHQPTSCASTRTAVPARQAAMSSTAPS